VDYWLAELVDESVLLGWKEIWVIIISMMVFCAMLMLLQGMINEDQGFLVHH